MQRASPWRTLARRVARRLLRPLAPIACALAAAGGAVDAWAQAQPPSAPAHRPRLALVLSGGGAMGIAHVGAIQELERLGIRPDVVVGTSMGSIVGGLYASGMDGQQLEAAVKNMNWPAIFDPSPPRQGLNFRQKQQLTDFPVKPSVGVAKGKLRAPDSLISDANLLLELRRLLRDRAAVPTFDDLAIPFRAVATDIETGEKVVLDRGELAGAMRASMSVPGVFAPYHLNGKLLVDGGMSDNVPIDVARDLGAEIVIVVATQTPMAKGEDVRSVPQVLGQTVTMLILANERQQLATLKPSDVLIRVEMNGLGAADFTEGQAFIDAGRKAALTQEGELRRVAGTRPGTTVAKASPPPPVIDYVRIENDSRLSDKVLSRRVDPFVGKPLDIDGVVSAMQEIYATGVFSRVDFNVERDGGRTGLVIHGQQKAGDANRLRLGVTIAAPGDGRSEFDISADFRMLQLDKQGSEARFVGVLGERKFLSAEYFKVLDSRQRWFVAPSIELQKRPVPIYDADGFSLGEYDVKYGLATFAVGRQLGTFGEVRFGIQRGAGDADLQSGLVLPADIDIDIGQVFASYGMDTFDSAYFPTVGVRGGAKWLQGLEDLGDSTDYQQVTAGGAWAVSPAARHTFIANLEAGDSFQGAAPVQSIFRLGGPFSFPGYEVDELTGQSYAVGRLMYRYKLTDSSKQLFNIPLYAGVTLVAGNTYARNIDLDDVRVGANAFVAADTLIGPVFFSVGVAESGRQAFYLFIGRPF